MMRVGPERLKLSHDEAGKLADRLTHDANAPTTPPDDRGVSFSLADYFRNMVDLELDDARACVIVSAIR